MTEYIVVLSGKGGTGKTSVSVALAKTLNAGLLDVDLMGPNVPETLQEDDPERHSIGTGDTIKPAVHDGLEVMSLSYELVDNTVFLQESEFEEKFVYDWINSIDWESDIVVVDSPPGTDTPTRTILKELPKPYAAIVTTGQDSSIQDCRRTEEMINHLNREEDANIQKLGIIENFAYYKPPRWLKKLIEEADEEDLPDDGDTTLPLLGHNNLSKDFELPLLARIPFCHDRVNRRDEVAVAIESLIHQEEHPEIIEVVKESLEYGHKKDNLEDFSIFKEVPDEPEEEEDSEGEADEDGSPKMIPIDEEELTQIEGIGPGYSSRIADEYEDYYDIMVRGAENVSEATGVPEKTIERLKDNIEGGEFVG